METKIDNKRLEVSLDLVNKIPSTSFIQKRSFSWLTNEQIASILISTDKHNEWFTKTRVLRQFFGYAVFFIRNIIDIYKQKLKRNILNNIGQYFKFVKSCTD